MKLPFFGLFGGNCSRRTCAILCYYRTWVTIYNTTLAGCCGILILMMCCTFVFILVTLLLLVFARFRISRVMSAVVWLRMMMMMMMIQNLQMIQLGGRPLYLVSNICFLDLFHQLPWAPSSMVVVAVVSWLLKLLLYYRSFTFAAEINRFLHFLWNDVRKRFLSLDKWDPPTVVMFLSMSLVRHEGYSKKDSGNNTCNEDHHTSCALDLPISLPVLVFVCQCYIHGWEKRDIDIWFLSRRCRREGSTCSKVDVCVVLIDEFTFLLSEYKRATKMTQQSEMTIF